jgi:hypothetical protein
VDILPNRYDVDALPYVTNPFGMPPIFQRWMFATLNRGYYDQLKKRVRGGEKVLPLDESVEDEFPPLKTVTLAQWVKAFNFTIVNLVKNGYMGAPPKPKTVAEPELLDVMVSSLKPTAPPKSKRGIGAIKLNLDYQRDAEERPFTLKVQRAFVTMAKQLKGEVAAVEESRRASE